MKNLENIYDRFWKACMRVEIRQKHKNVLVVVTGWQVYGYFLFSFKYFPNIL